MNTFRKNLLSLVLLLIILTFSSSYSQFAGGTGTEEDPYLVETAVQLDSVRHYLNAHFKQIADINLNIEPYNSEAGWNPIGYHENINNVEAFKGVYDGQDYNIYSLYMHNTDSYNTVESGLFGVLEDAYIKNVNLRNVYIKGTWYVGMITGYNFQSIIENCSAIGSVTGNAFMSGLCGYSEGPIIKNSYYDLEYSFINGENLITIGALNHEMFEQWMNNGKTLDINDYLENNEDGYIVSDPDDLEAVSAFGYKEDYSFVLESDINLSSKENFYIPYFRGSFNGNGYEISGINIDMEDFSYIGLFGYCVNAEISDLTASSQQITANWHVGILNAVSYFSTINDCVTQGEVHAGWGAAGVSALVSGELNSCRNYAVVTGDFIGGGIAGYLFDDTNIISCSNYASIEGGSAGGISASLSHCNVSRCANSGNVNGTSNSSGGISAYMEYNAYIYDCFNSGNISGGNAGGLAGIVYDTVTVNNSYSSGIVEGEENEGGLIGVPWVPSKNEMNRKILGLLTPEDISALKEGKKTKSEILGFDKTIVFENKENVITVNNSYWDIEASGQTESYGGGEGRTTDEMIYPYSENTYTGWDFTDIWQADTDGSINGGYPYLLSDYVSVDDSEIISPIIKGTNYPNPFNPSTVIEYNLPESGDLQIEVYNINGQLIRELYSGYAESGSVKKVIWDGRDDFGESVSSGIYFYRIISGSGKFTGKMLLIK